MAIDVTRDGVGRYLDSHPITSASDRSKLVEKVASQVNQLSYDQRRQAGMGKKLNAFFRTLSPDEQARYLDLTLPAGFKQMMDALNNMTKEKRKEFVDKTLAEMKKHEGEDAPEDGRKLDSNGQKIIDQGFRSFYSDASAETKMDVAPLIEQLQRNLQGLR